MKNSNKSNLILVVDDEAEIQRLMLQRFRKKIQSGELAFQFAQNGVDAIQILRDSHEISVVLTDIRMPEMDGLTLLSNLAEFDRPLKAVVVSAYGDMKNIRTAMNWGAFDFVTKPIDFADLEITLNKTLAFVNNLQEKEQKLQEALNTLHNLVFYDQLTGMPNRNGLIKYIAKSIVLKQTRGDAFALLILDIERYAIIKSGFGHALSDRLLIEVAKRLEQWNVNSKVVARLDNNELAVLLQDLESPASLTKYIKQLHQLFEVPIQLDEISISSLIHVGVASSDLPYDQPEDILRAADTAIHYAKQAVGTRTVFFDTNMQQKALQRLNLEVNLQEAIKLQNLEVHYQPIFQLKTSQLIGFEALVRWQHPTQEWLSPLKFIPLAEETGLIVRLGNWVLREACLQLQRWQKLFGNACPTRISVNLSSLQLVSPTLLQNIDQTLSDTGLSGENLILEITETVLMENIQEAVEVLQHLRDRCIGLSIDDFGTGYSSLSYLQSLPLTALKIDRSFIQNIESNQTNLEITSTIIELAKRLGLKVVAEGLEKEIHVDILRSLNCDYGQGFLFSRPIPADEATKLIAEQLR
ncbi:putative bifunctional diguanylate cyclase/phosphodiesterase [Pseudanabaena sp. Chao 1811]|uniref:putative bifunctional diguanylate cyclase/phosphodiesterase n=1 Tax=Pseudanabaena sp. Chao 1811 TaxID=2963092 RepID=UPI0022F40755|nr:EAL domain-containing response regulator [Pseudanabaena sp. Chao 1811]